MLNTYDYQCKICGKAELLVDSVTPETPEHCGEPMAISYWSIPHTPNIHPMDRPVVWEQPGTGEIRHPGRNDAPMPDHYRARGFVRREFTSYTEHQRWNKERGLVNHAAEGIK